MALVVKDRVQELTTTSGTGTLTLSGAVPGFQTFSSSIGNGNTTFYTIYDNTAQEWEVGIGTVGAGTLARTTVLSNYLGTTALVSFVGNSSFVFCTYPAEQSVNLDASNNVSPLGTIASGTWQGSTIGVAYGGTGVTTSSGANSVMLRDSNQNVAVNRLNQSNTATTAAAGTTALTAASSYSQTLNGTGTQTYTMPDATTLTTGVAFVFNNNATGTLTLQDYATGPIGTITSGGAVELVLLSNGTVAGTWDVHGFLPENVTWGTNALNLGSTVITNGTWQGGTIQSAYGGTGLTTFAAANNALYSTSSSALVAGTLPSAAGGTGFATYTTGDIIYASATNTLSKLAAGTNGYVLTLASGVPSWATNNAATTRTVSNFTATASQTTFTVAYTVGLIDVYRNGVKLAAADFTATNGTSVILATGANSGDVIETVAYSALSIGTGVNSFSGGTTGFTPAFGTGTVTLAGTLNVANGGTGTSTAFTTGSVVFAGASGTYTQDNANFFWDDTNNRLGIGTTSPTRTVDVVGNLRLGSSNGRFIEILNATSQASYISQEASAELRLNQETASADSKVTFRTQGLQRMVIDSSGNVGIGTLSPSYLLNASKNGGGGDSAQLARFTDTSTSNSIGPLHLTIGAANHFAVSPSPVLCGTNGIAFGVGDGSDLATQRKMIIHSSGGVSIGNTTDPGATNLSVTGAITTGGNTVLSTAGNQQISARNVQGGSQNVGTMLTATGSLGGLELINPGGANAAFMTFHRSGVYASYFGIDTDNQFAVGGWSAGAALASFKAGSLGVGQAASGTAGEIRATGAITTGGNAVLSTAGNATITGGFRITSFNLGNTSGATITPNALSSNYQYASNNGAGTIAAPTADCAIDILLQNTTGAGAITFTGFTVVAGNIGDPLTTTTTAKFIISIRRIIGVSTYIIKQIAT